MKQAQRIIIDHLRAMREELDKCEQTTHVHILAIGTLEHVGKDMEAAFDNPTAYHVANLAQTIDEFLKLAASPDFVGRDASGNIARINK